MRSEMKQERLLIFAHVPPPFHGQSVMVQQLVRYLTSDRDDARIRCWHVDARLSDDLEDVGRARFGKLFALWRHCREALRLQREHQISGILIVPAPPKRGAVIRDWILMTLMRRRFERVINYWQAAGLARWLDSEVDLVTRRISRRIMGKVDLSIVLGESLREDAEFFESRRVEVVPNFMPDPAPPDIESIISNRLVRLESLRITVAFGCVAVSEGCLFMEVLFMSLCTRSKGLFDVLEGVALANQRLSRVGQRLRVRLTVAGGFEDEQERSEFEKRMKSLDLMHEGKSLVDYRGFVHGDEKIKLFQNTDCLCFPTYYAPEAFPTVIVEAMAWGVPVVTTRWRAIPELLPEDYSLFVSPRAPEEVCEQIFNLWHSSLPSQLRKRFLKRNVDQVGLPKLENALVKAWD